MSSASTDKDKFSSNNYAVTGSFTPTAFRFYQAQRSDIDKIFLDKPEHPINSFRALASVEVAEEGYVGTNYAYAESEVAPKKAKSNGAVEEGADMRKSPNPGRREIARLTGNRDTLAIAGTLKYVDSFRTPLMSDNETYRAVHENLVANYLRNENLLRELLTRYLSNIANGRILWRNQWGFNRRAVFTLRSHDVTKNFYVTTPDCTDFSELVAHVTAIVRKPKSYFYLDIGLSVELSVDEEVFPSQRFEDSEASKSNKLSRKLAFLPDANGNKQAIFSAQKVGNALRTVDIWYNDPQNNMPPEPIAVEVYGAVTRLRQAHRLNNKNSYYDLMKQVILDSAADPTTAGANLTPDELQYLMAVLIKGGVLACPAKK